MCLKPICINHIYVACGKCVECLQKKSLEWSYRIMLEASLYEHNCFITLTYNEDNLPAGASLKRADLQKFVKRLRKHLSANAIKIRYFYCGEYGKKGGRPHYHIIIFGWKPSDLVYYSQDNKNTKLYRSATIEKLWTLGYSAIGEVTSESALYCAKYLNKGLSDKGQENSFIGMSLKPCIGYNKLKDEWLDTDKIYVRGKSMRIPRAYIKQFEKNPIYKEKLRLLKVGRLFNSGCVDCLKLNIKISDNVYDLYQIYTDYAEMKMRREIFNLKNREKNKKLEKLIKSFEKAIDK